MFIEKLPVKVNPFHVMLDLKEILKHTAWGEENQIGLTYRKGSTDPWKDCVGSLYDRERNIELTKESEFTELNDLIPDYTKSILKDLEFSQGIKIGRTRLMNLESKRGLTVHHDISHRYHLVLKTNPHAYIGEATKDGAICHHMPLDGHFYKVDTTKNHFVYNGGTESRIHLVICPLT